MRLTRTGKPDNFYYYVIEDYKNDKGQKKTRTVESLGCARVIREKFGVDDAEQWCREYIAKKNNEIKEFKENNCRSISINQCGLQLRLFNSRQSLSFFRYEKYLPGDCQ